MLTYGKVLIVWNPGKGSPVHDHADAHCVMKILQGSLKETMFHIPHAQEQAANPLKTKKETIYSSDQVAYISDKIGLHRISNPDGQNAAVSLHCKYLEGRSDLAKLIEC